MIIERTDCKIDFSYHQFQRSQIYLQFFRIFKVCSVYTMFLRWRCQRTDRMESLKKILKTVQRNKHIVFCLILMGKVIITTNYHIYKRLIGTEEGIKTAKEAHLCCT